MNFDPYRHGGRLTDAAAAFPAAPTPWLDLSTGVNPYPWRGGKRAAADACRLPDPASRSRLEAVAAAAFGVSPDSIAAVAGADCGLRLLPHVLNVNRVAIVSPTYGGHAEAWQSAGASVRPIAAGALLAADADVAVVVNPNNPDGAVHRPEALRELAERQAARGGWVLVDESFGELDPGLSVAPHIHERMIVLRSFGKFYGLPGVRLGFIVAVPAMIARLRAVLGDWPVSAEAIALGAEAYADVAWQSAMRQRLAADSLRLGSALVRAGFIVIGGTSLFHLASRPDARDVFLRLAQAGILVRPFVDRPSWLRIGLPPRRSWKKLAAALKALP